MGANHIGEIKDLVEIAKPNYGIITNIGIAHIGEFGNFENIINTKKELYDGVLKNKGKIFINENDKILKEISKDFKNEDKIFYIEANELPTNDNYLRLELNNQLLKTSLVGNYNIPNVQAAYTVGKFFKISEDKILKSITEYTPTNNRSQKENSDMNNTIIWDCYNANPTSMGLAIESFTSTNTNNNYFFLGEMAELGEYSYSEHLKLLTVLEELNGIKVLIGNEFKKIVEYSEKEQEKFVFLNNVDELENFIKSRKIINSNILIKGSNSTKLFNLYGKKII
jgi:UDP-N-acetylmuramoyl-tripeptide--D-alanyl-D-alanine ligase